MVPEFIHVAVADTEPAFSLLDAVMDAGPIGILTMLLLLIFSVVSWAVIFMKWKVIRAAEQQSAAFLDMFWESKQLDDIYGQSDDYPSSPVAKVFRAGFRELRRIEQRSEGDASHLDGAENIARSLRRAGSSQLTELERLTPFLATVGSTAPFIGLFGTVVGIINAFSDIAKFKRASLTTVAPGIAEALVATAAGLLAAIPAVIAYNAFSARLRVLSSEMENFSSDFMNIVKRHF